MGDTPQMQNDEVQSGQSIHKWDMELVEIADISAVLEDAMHEAADPKQKNALSNMLLELNKSPLAKRDI
jgi:hypothetical protein